MPELYHFIWLELKRLSLNDHCFGGPVKVQVLVKERNTNSVQSPSHQEQPIVFQTETIEVAARFAQFFGIKQVKDCTSQIRDTKTQPMK